MAEYLAYLVDDPDRIPPHSTIWMDSENEKIPKHIIQQREMTLRRLHSTPYLTDLHVLADGGSQVPISVDELVHAGMTEFSRIILFEFSPDNLEGFLKRCQQIGSPYYERILEYIDLLNQARDTIRGMHDRETP